MAVALLTTMPINIQAAEVDEPLNISETADSGIPQEDWAAPEPDDTWPELSDGLPGLGDTLSKPDDASTKPAKNEFNINSLTASPKPYWPEGSKVSVRERTYEQIHLEWTPAENPGGTMVEYTVSTYKGSDLIRTSDHLSAHEHVAFDLLPDTSYRFDIVANDMEGNVSEVLSQTISTLSVDGFAPPFWPTGSILTASNKTHNTVSLSWSQAEDGKQTGNPVTGYAVYQGATQLGTVTGSSNTSYGVTGLSPDTTYTFKVQAVNEKTKWTIDGPSVTVTTNPQLAPGATELRLNAPRKNINGSLYMGDKVSLELMATESGLTPTVKVTYEEWDAGRNAVEEKTKDVTLTATPLDSKIYEADFELTEGISKIISLQAVVQSETITTELNLAVAGRLKVEAAPGAISPEEEEEFNKIIAESFVRVSKTGTNSLTARFPGGNQAVTIEGLDAAADYKLQHCLGYDMLLHEAPSVEIKAGLETGLAYAPKTPARVKVLVMDNSGKPLSNVTIKGEAVLLNGDGTSTMIFARTDENGIATADGIYFAQNVVTGSEIKLEASYKTNSKNPTDWYEEASLSKNISKIGDNEIEVRLKKVPIVTLQGIVTNHKNEPIKNANVLMTQTYTNGSVINTSCQTDDKGQYTMQVAQIDGEISVNTESNSVEKAITLNDGTNIHDVKVPLPELASLNLIVKTMNLSGITTTLDFSQFNPRQLRVQVLNITRPGTSQVHFPSPDFPYFRTNAKPGDQIRITLDGEGFSYGNVTVDATLDEKNYAEVTALLKQYGRVTAYVTDRDGKQRQGETRYLYVYTDNGSYVGSCPSSAPNLSGYLPSGRYKAVISWEQTRIANFSQWQDDPKCVLHSEVFTVQDGQVTDLGSKAPIYKARDTRYFRHNVASGLSSSHSLATPGTIMTLRAVYDYDKVVPASVGLKFVADIPSGTELVEKSVVYRRIKGSKDVTPNIDGNCITLDLEDDEVSAAGSLTYQVKVQDIKDYKEIGASFRLKYMIYGEPQLEEIGSVAISTKRIILNAPTEVEKADALKPVKLSGLAPADNIVELWDGNIKIGEVIAAPTGLWSAAVLLPDRGMPIFHAITAKTRSEGRDYADSATILVGVEGTQLERIIFTQGANSRGIDPKSDVTAFPFAVDPFGKFEVSAIFNDGDKVQNVKIAGNRAERKGNAFTAHIMNNIASIPVEYNEKSLELKEVLKYDHGKVPTYITEAEVKFADATKMTKDVKYEVGADGYLNSLDLPAVNLTMGNVNATVSMKAEQVDFDPANAKSRTPLGNGMYAYDFSYELVDGKYVITAYLDRRLLPVSAGKQKNRMMTMSSVATGLKFVNTSIEVYSKGESLMGAFGDLSKSAKMAELLINYESVRPNLQPHMAEYYDNQLSSMGKDILMGKTLGMVGEGVGNAANFVPLVGQVVAGIAGIISGKLLGDMFDNEFDSDYNRLTTQLKGLSGWPKWGSGNEWDGWFWYDGDSYYRTGRTTINPRYIFDPSGYVYEAVEDNRIPGVTAMVLYLPTDKAEDAANAKASIAWEVWDAEWYLQENPLTTDADGKYAWDVPEGWWMVQFIKDGYQTAYSDALKVLPPQVDINIPIVQLSWPQVEKTVWGSGGRYVDVYFSKYMDMSLFKAVNAVSLTDDTGALISGSLKSSVPEKTGVGGLSLTKAVRFTPESWLEVGKEYQLTVNKAVSDYAGFSMEEDFTETALVTPTALISGLSGRNIEVQPGKDITSDIKNAVTFTAADPGMENSLDKRLVFTSSDDSVVKIWGEGDEVKIVSLAEGKAEITAVSVDDSGKSTEFNVTVKYPPLPIGVTHMTILNAGGMALTDLSIHSGETYAIKPDLFPANATDKTITYSSDNEQVATVNASGVIRALAKGIAEIRVRTENSAVMQTIHLTVLPAQSGTGENGGSGGGKTVTSSTIPAANGAVQVSYTSSNGTATLSLPAATINEIIEKSQGGEAVIDLSNVSSVTAVSLPKDALTAFAKAGLDVTVKLPAGTITLDNDALTSVEQQADGSNMTIELKQTAVSSLTDAQKKSVKSGDIVLDINIYSGTEKIINFDGMLTAQIPYTGPQPVDVWYLNDKGELEKLSCTFQNGVVSFDLDHLSLYVVGQGMVKNAWANPFTDVKEADWFYTAVSFCAEKGITKGTSATTFSPDATLTRGQFITMLLKAYGIEPAASPTDNFADAGSTYYTGYLAAAKAKGISNGVGDNKFVPEKAITRQEMFTLMYNALKVLNKLPTADNGKTLADFIDSGDVVSWASEGMTALVKSGIISGSGGNLNPTGGSTRAQMAQVLYNLLEK